MKKDYIAILGMVAFVTIVIVAAYPSVSKFAGPEYTLPYERFSFADYTTKEIPEILKKKFPVGSTREYVDNLLIRTGAAKSYENATLHKNYHEISYTEAPNFSKRLKMYGFRNFINPNGEPFYNFYYDRDNKLINIWSYYGGYIFKEQPTSAEIEGIYKIDGRLK